MIEDGVVGRSDPPGSSRLHRPRTVVVLELGQGMPRHALARLESFPTPNLAAKSGLITGLCNLSAQPYQLEKVCRDRG